MQLSKLEFGAIDELKKNNLQVFRIKDICLLLRVEKTKAYNIVKALKKKGSIEQLRNGLFALKGTNEFAEGALLNWPSYLSFWSALNYYGFSDQTPKTILFASTRYKKQAGRFKFVVLSKKRFFGYESTGEFPIAEKEKAIIDSLLFPKHSGGVKEVFNALKNSLNEIDSKKLMQYAFKVESKAVLRRLGFLLEEYGIKGKALMELKRHKGKGFELLDPSLNRKNKFNKKWLLDINW